MEDYNNIPQVSQPKGLNISLFPHQLASIYKMEMLETEKLIETSQGIFKETRLGINADQTGYGKTLSMIGLIVRNKMDWDQDTPFVWENINMEAAGLIRSREIQRYDKLPTTLILVSPSIVSQWQKELSHTNLRVYSLISKRFISNVNVYDYDVILVTPSTFNLLCICYTKHAWKRFIFDEPGHLKVPGMKPIIAGFYWLITATPETIIYKHKKSCSFMKDIVGEPVIGGINEKFEGMIIKNSINFVQASFSMPLTFHHYHRCYHPLYKIASGLVNDTILMMISAGNIEGAILELGGKKTDNIVQLIKEEKMNELEKIRIDIKIYRDLKQDDKKLTDSIKKEKNILSQLETLDTRFNDILKDNCSICMNKLNEPVLEPCCQNLFCGKCLLTWLEKSKTCPLCRNHISLPELIYLCNGNNNTQINTTFSKKLTQLEKVIELITKKEDSKFLIFSAYDATFIPICRLLSENNITFSQIKGSQKTREKNINNFKYGNTKVIFLNSTFDGAGINLQEATDIILYHEMSESMERQIIGRANRIGRINPLQVHHLQVDI